MTSVKDIEQEIGSILAELLEIEELDYFEDFKNLGAESIALTRFHRRLNKLYPDIVKITDFFIYASIAKLAEHIYDRLKDQDAAETEESHGADASEKKDRSVREKDIAIIGMALKYPGAQTLDEFWSSLKNAVDASRDFPANRRDDIYPLLKKKNTELVFAKGAYLDEIDTFDYSFFNIAPAEARVMSPEQKLFLETSYKAVEDAGYGGDKLKGSNTGVYVGFVGRNLQEFKYYYRELISDIDNSSLAAVGNLSPIVASRISYYLNLKGPSVMFDSACSSSLVATYFACQELRQGKCEMAIVGGVRLSLVPLKDNEAKVGIESSDGKARAFDDSADGTSNGEGSSAIVIKLLSKAIADGDNIYAVIKGSAINQDGATAGITVPSPVAQADVIEKAWLDAEVEPESIGYIEAHGTATNLGDPIEIEGLTRAFSKYTEKKQFCGIGSLKSNFGHTYESAGVVAIIKSALSLKNKEIAPSLHFNVPNRNIDFVNSPVYVSDRLHKWVSGSYPRRCGVSAFGMSGTNAHIVLEEAPGPIETGKDKGPYLFAVSGKDKKAVEGLLKSYKIFLENSIDAALRDICYTAHTGRGHYTHRIIFYVNSKQELINSIQKVIDSSLDTIKENNIYYGYHKLITSQKKEKLAGDIFVDEKKEISVKGNTLLEKIALIDSDEGLIQEVCQLYIQGADLNWDILYKNEQRRRVSLPGYVFDRKRSWIEFDDLPERSDNDFSEKLHPLVHKRIAKTMGQEIYSTMFTFKEHWVLSDHIIMGNPVIPGTTYFELLRKATEHYFPDGMIEFKDLVFSQPVILNDENDRREVHVILQESDEKIHFNIVSKIDGAYSDLDEWIKHAEGYIRHTNRKTILYDINELKKECSLKEEVIDINGLSEGWIVFGPRWMNIKKMYFGADSTLIEQELPADLKSDLDIFHIHPSLLDMATAGEVVYWGTSKRYLPLRYKSVKVYDRMPARFYAYLKKIDKDFGETFSFDIALLKEDGAVFMEIERFTLKKVRQFRSLIRKNMFHKLNWITKELEKTNAASADGLLVMYKPRTRQVELLQKLEQKNKNVIKAQIGNSFKKLQENEYVVSNEESSYSALWQEIKNKPVSQIVLLQNIVPADEEDSLENLKANIEDGVFGLFFIVRSLINSKIQAKIDLVLVAQNADEVTGKEYRIVPSAAALFGLGKVIAKEHSNITCRCIDIDDMTDIAYIIDELGNDFLKNRQYKIAYRENVRYYQEFAAENLEDVPDKKFEIKENGVYLVTGGTGGIGLEMSKLLAAKAKTHLVFITRSLFPDRNRWEEILKENTNKKLVSQITSINGIESRGSTVAFYMASVDNLEAMQATVDNIRESYHVINGIVHCAGVAGDGFIIKKDKQVFADVLAPKIYGTWILHYLTKDDNLDFFINCSSVAALTASAGQGDYTAGNSYLDSFSYYRNKKGQRTMSINWPAWKETGMAVDFGANLDSVFKAITTKDAIAAFEEAMNKDLKQAVIGELNYELITDMAVQPFLLSKDIKLVLERVKTKLVDKKAGAKSLRDEEIKLAGRADGQYTAIEIKLGQVWGKVLGYKELNIYDNFYVLGGDSIQATKMMPLIEKYNIKMDLTDLFEYLTIHDLAKYIEEKTVSETTSVSHQDEGTIQSISTDELKKLIKKTEEEGSIRMPDDYGVQCDFAGEVNVKGTAIHYEYFGKKNRQAIVIFNGLVQSTVAWYQYLPTLCAVMDVLLWDYKGQGASGVDDAIYTLEEFADHLKDVVDKLELKPKSLNLMGISIGAIIAAEFLRKYSYLVNTAILSGAILSHEIFLDHRLELSMRLSSKNFYLWVNSFFKDIISETFFNTLGLETVQILMKRTYDRYVPLKKEKALTNTTEAQKNYLSHVESYYKDFKSVDVPVLIITGEHDVWIPAYIQKRITNLFNIAYFKEYPATGHLVFVEKPKQFMQDCVDFFKDRLAIVSATATDQFKTDKDVLINYLTDVNSKLSMAMQSVNQENAFIQPVLQGTEDHKNISINYEFYANKARPTLIILNDYMLPIGFINAYVAGLYEHVNILVINYNITNKTFSDNSLPSYAAYADALKKILDRPDMLEAGRLCLLGIASGGLFALEFLKKYGNMVSKVVISGTLVSEEQINNFRIDLVKDLFRESFADGISYHLATSFGEKFFKDHDSFFIEKFKNVLAYNKESIKDGYIKMMEMEKEYLKNISQYYPELKAVETPILAIVGAQDITAPVYAQRKALELFKNLEYVEYTETGHFPLLEKPEVFFNHVINYIKENR